MADRKETTFPGLRVDRLAEAVEAARAKAHAAAASRAARPPEDPPTTPEETPPPRPEEVPGPAPDAPPEVEPGDLPPEEPPDAPPETPPDLPEQPPEPLRPDEPPEPSAPGEVPPPPSEVPPGRPSEVPSPPPEVPGGPGPELPDTGPVEIPEGPTMAASGLPLPPPLILDARHRVPDRPDRPDGPAPDERAQRRITAVTVAAALRRDAGRPPVAAPARPVAALRTAEAPTLLRLTGVAAVIGGYPILSHVDLRVPRGGITVLAGRAGAGRTATLRTIMGLERASAGEIAFDGEDLTRQSPARIARRGIAHVPEDAAVFARLTVAQNVALAASGGPVRRDRLDWIFATFPALERLWRTRAGALSGGQRRMLALACAMAEPRRLYLIDEPARDLPQSALPAVIQVLRDLRQQGAAILLAVSDPALAEQVGDLATILEDGRSIWSGPAANLHTAPGLTWRRPDPAAEAVA